MIGTTSDSWFFDVIPCSCLDQFFPFILFFCFFLQFITGENGKKIETGNPAWADRYAVGLDEWTDKPKHLDRQLNHSGSIKWTKPIFLGGNIHYTASQEATAEILGLGLSGLTKGF